MTARRKELVSVNGTSGELMDVVVIGGSQAGLAPSPQVSHLSPFWNPSHTPTNN